jgi:mono/diheme cytochrome c family protein
MNRAKIMIAGALLAAALALAGPAWAADVTAEAANAAAAADASAAVPAALAPGKALFDRHCSFCHAAGPGHAGTMRLTEARGAAKALLEARTDLDPAYIRLVVRQGLVEMPPWRKVELDDAALQQIVAYLTRPR